MKSRYSSPHRPRPAFTLTVCVGVLTLGPGSAPAAQLPGAAPVEAAVDMVLIDCIVLDDEGNFMPGLTQDDFRLYEEGEPVDVSYFSMQRFGAASELTALPADAPADSPSSDSLPGNSQVAALPRYVVLFIDGFNTSPAEWGEVQGAVVEYAREILMPGDRILVANLTPARQLRVAPEFTSELGLLEAVLSSVQTNPDIRISQVRNTARLIAALQAEDEPGGGTDEGAETTALSMGSSLAGLFARERREQVLFTLDTVTGLADHLDRTFVIPGPKTLLMVSGGISVQPGSSYFYILDAYEQRGSLELRSQGEGGGHDPFSRRSGGEEVDQYLEVAVGKLNRLNYSVYTIDARGAEDFYGDSPEYQVRTGLAADIRQQIFENDQNGLATIARGTGGLSFSGTSDFLRALESIHADTAFRYVLGYLPPEHDPKDTANEKFYRVRVEVGAPGARVRASEGYVDR